MEKKDWEFIKGNIELILNTVKSELELSSIENIQHYIEHDEFEMAFEILFIEIMKLKDLPVLDFKKCKKIGEQLGLDTETVFDPLFWDKFVDFVDAWLPPIK